MPNAPSPNLEMIEKSFKDGEECPYLYGVWLVVMIFETGFSCFESKKL